jgi:DNA-binding transcriptional MerR regulator/methylmalonyl-CoA mutase cobalamin-binding subunit
MSWTDKAAEAAHAPPIEPDASRGAVLALALAPHSSSPVLSAPAPEGPVVAGGQASFSISTVERDTGLSKDTLRIWQRRYGFPIPQRGAHGERLYPAGQVEKLQCMVRLLRAGHRPGQLAHKDIGALRAMVARGPAGLDSAREAPGQDTELESSMQALMQADRSALRRCLAHAQGRLGLACFVADLIAPLATRVGQAWADGKLHVFQEHIFSETVQAVLRQALLGLPEPAADARPRVLLTTLPGEPHGLGLLMAEAMFAIEGCACLGLGVQTPVADVAVAARSQAIDIVGLSFSGVLPARAVHRSLEELSVALGPGVALWVGGAAPGLRPGENASWRSVRSLRGITPALQEWRTVMMRSGVVA